MSLGKNNDNIRPADTDGDGFSAGQDPRIDSVLMDSTTARLVDIKFDGIDGEVRSNPTSDGSAGRRQAADDDMMRPRRVRHDQLDDVDGSATDALDISGQGAGDPIPTESISFNFGGVEMLNNKNPELNLRDDSVWDDTDIVHVVSDDPAGFTYQKIESVTGEVAGEGSATSLSGDEHEVEYDL